MKKFAAVALFPALLIPAPQGQAPTTTGVMVMAHGGSKEWDKTVLDAVKPLQAKIPLEVAFGMADPATMQAAVEKLEKRGVKQIAVVRVFISGDSFLDRTEKILGLKPGAPPRPRHPGHDHGDGDHGDMPLWRLETKASFHLSREGLMDDPQKVGAILAERLEALTKIRISVAALIIGHGPADDEENKRWLKRMNEAVDVMRAKHPFMKYMVETLREDWPEKREEAEKRIRKFVSDEVSPYVIPYRLSGFGPYAEVLKDLKYTSDGKGLLPNPRITDWIKDQAVKGFKEKGWDHPLK